ncbi:DUF3347 domain-containing protein [Chitinophaga niabensis]|uniref:DUF3347 domain-containing protein n=1 Tax=Chitinophaga niabensis TaxID=536979 RepID=A0A1N6K2Z2_9BACT|nr:DUF3347 domain-containing protein [Chitinophaga niabensis]SIO50919.1 Protein of unknown function [Chitinophaga niabensis]
MKTFLFAALLFSTKADAQLSNLLTSYYNIKNALVTSNGNTAAAQADEFVKALKAIDKKSLSEADRKAFEPLQEKLAFDAEHIAETKDIGHQRDHFESFSENFYKLAKAVKLSDKPIYQSYCPMKKAYWLSNEATIKNPYYGSQMLTCGKISDTIK